MDRAIRKIERDTKKVSGELKSLEREDKKHDKIIERAKKKLKGKR